MVENFSVRRQSVVDEFFSTNTLQPRQNYLPFADNRQTLREQPKNTISTPFFPLRTDRKFMLQNTLEYHRRKLSKLVRCSQILLFNI
jgi:hypothetical protein